MFVTINPQNNSELPPRRAHFLRHIAALLLLASLLASRAAAADAPAPSKEYQVKAAFLLNFIQFIQWPAGTFAADDSPITVGVLGDDPFGAVLDETFKDELVAGRKLVIKRSRQVEELKDCNLLFIGKSEKDRLAETMTALKEAHAVTVGETEHFVQGGGIINFFLDNNKVRFEIDPTLAEKKGLKVSSQLLKRAKIVKAEN